MFYLYHVQSELQYEYMHWTLYMPACDCGSAAVTFWLCSVVTNGQILRNFWLREFNVSISAIESL